MQAYIYITPDCFVQNISRNFSLFINNYAHYQGKINNFIFISKEKERKEKETKAPQRIKEFTSEVDTLRQLKELI